MLFGEPGEMSIRRLIQVVLKEYTQLDGMTGDKLWNKYAEMLNTDGCFKEDRFRGPLIEAVQRGDKASVQALTELCGLNTVWLKMKSGTYGPIITNEIENQLNLGSLESTDYILPVMVSYIQEWPELRPIINNLIKDGWLLHKKDIVIGNLRFAIFLAATKPVHKKHNK